MLKQETINAITEIAASSDLNKYDWDGRGRAPVGYVKGMAATFGLCLQKLMVQEPEALAMVRVVEDGEDVFDHYAVRLSKARMSTDGASDIDRLRTLFVILTGLGMRESSGRYCEGRDRSASNTTADTAEAGAFQQSWDSHRAVPEIASLIEDEAIPSFLDIFKEGVSPRAGDLDNYGTGEGLAFQLLCKANPRFAVEAAALGLRTLYTHWGPIVRREVEIVPEADTLFRRVQSLVGADATVATPPVRGWFDWLFAKRHVPAPVPAIPTAPAPVQAASIPWMAWAEKEIGFHETGINRGTERYVDLSKNGSRADLVGEPWCADFSNASFEVSGIRGTRSAMARSYEHSDYFVKLDGPAYGAVVTMWRGSKESGSGHVFFYVSESEKGVLGLGGNQSDSVCRAYHPRNRIVGYFWPKSCPLPKVGKITVQGGDAAEGGSET